LRQENIFQPKPPPHQRLPSNPPSPSYSLPPPSPLNGPPFLIRLDPYSPRHPIRLNHWSPTRVLPVWTPPLPAYPRNCQSWCPTPGTDGFDDPCYECLFIPPVALPPGYDVRNLIRKGMGAPLLLRSPAKTLILIFFYSWVDENCIDSNFPKPKSPLFLSAFPSVFFFGTETWRVQLLLFPSPSGSERAPNCNPSRPLIRHFPATRSVRDQMLHDQRNGPLRRH